MGRPPTKPKKLRDGFYIEVRNRGANSGIKLVLLFSPIHPLEIV